MKNPPTFHYNTFLITKYTWLILAHFEVLTLIASKGFCSFFVIEKMVEWLMLL